MITPRTLLFFLPLAACFDKHTGESGVIPDDCLDVCGDVDGDGFDTGNIPNILGSWSSTFGSQVFYENCGVEDLHQTSENWINGAAMDIGGYVPDGLFAYFDGDREEEFVGIINEMGGVVFSGRHQHSAGEMHVVFGGLVYHDEWREPPRDVIQGFVYMGLDVTDDGNIDCDARGGWTAIKSGS